MGKISKQNKKGFTLVELVVVIAILGILAGIAIPRFMEATKSARGAKIIADMRTIESALNVYYVKHSKYPADKNATGFADMVNGGTWPEPPIGNFTIVHTMSASGGDPTSGTCDDTTAYTYTYGDSDDIAGSVTLTDTSSLSHCANITSPTVMELLTTSSIASLFNIYNDIIAAGSGSIGNDFLTAFESSSADRTVSDAFLETYGINTESNDDLEWSADYNATSGGIVLFLTTSSSYSYSALAVITEDGTVYTSNATTTVAGTTYTDYSSIVAAVEGDTQNDGDISTEIGARLTSSGNFTQSTITLDI